MHKIVKKLRSALKSRRSSARRRATQKRTLTRSFAGLAGGEAAHHDSKAFIGQSPLVPATSLFGDSAYPTPDIRTHLQAQRTRLIAPQKKPKGGELTDDEKYDNPLVRSPSPTP